MKVVVFRRRKDKKELKPLLPLEPEDLIRLWETARRPSHGANNICQLRPPDVRFLQIWAIGSRDVECRKAYGTTPELNPGPVGVNLRWIPKLLTTAALGRLLSVAELCCLCNWRETPSSGR